MEDRDSASSQFYVCLKSIPELNNEYTVFGTVIHGKDVVDAIGNVEVQARGDFEMIPVQDVIIQSMRELP